MEDNHKIALIIAYYLSKFDEDALKNLKYSSFTSAFKDIALKLKVKPNTIKNMRDEFDPLHGNKRVGWYQRDLRPSRQQVVEQFQDLDEQDLHEIVVEVLENVLFRETVECEELLKSITENGRTRTGTSFILRGPTGKKAEEIFIEQFNHGNIQLAGMLSDMRDRGCGYDFEIHDNDSTYFIEVKGLAELSGGILFTNKEWQVAMQLKERYILAIVSNIVSEPEIVLLADPARRLNATKKIYRPVQINWTVSAREISRVLSP
ncbi:MAG: DUF3883 domain-containing protein [Clostridia bacterium]|nr:DUF3883 domain-containing protein [Clostridia bacterium]